MQLHLDVLRQEVVCVNANIDVYFSVSATIGMKWSNNLHPISTYPTTAEEMRAFVGVNVIVGIDQKPELCNYWSTDEFLGNVVIRAFMCDRFESLCRYLHINDSQKQPARNDTIMLYKVRPVLDTCQHTFLEQYIPGKEVSTA